MRICVFSDVHANFHALSAILKEAKNLGIDGYICLGDIVGYGPHPRECIQKIAELPNIKIIQGNHDHSIGTETPEFGCNRHTLASADWTIQQLSTQEKSWLASLPRECQEGNYMLVHGAPCDPNRFYGYIYEMTYVQNLEVANQIGLKLVLYGHTHIPFIHTRTQDGNCHKHKPETIELLEDKVILVNPGSVGQPRDGDPRAAFGIWEPKKNFSFHRVSYSVHLTMQDMIKHKLPDYHISRLEMGR